MANASRKGLWLKLGVLLAVLATGAVLVMRGVDVRGAIEHGLAIVRSAGPVAFFTAMAVLPAVGAPLMAFTIPAGEVFRVQLGLGGVIAAALVAIAINLALSYWLARYVMRPVLTGLLKRYGYSVPRITPENALSVLLLVRLTPGPPFSLQSILLGVAEAPFRLYMIVSWLAVLPWALGAIILGQGLLNGNVRGVIIGAGVLVVAVIGVQWVRKKYSRRGDQA